MTEILDVVDDNDNVLYTSPRDEVQKKALTHRNSYIIVRNYFKKFLVQKRSMNKVIFPGLWDLGVSETVVSGETYEAAAVRGLSEEIGVNVSANELSYLFPIQFRSQVSNTNILVLSFMYNGKLILQHDEIDEALFASVEDINDLISKKVFTPDGALVFRRFMENDSKHRP